MKKINIVCKVGGDHVLARLARVLAEETGWTLATIPDPEADVNYWLPYLDFEPSGGKSAAWFTHRDEALPKKIAAWEVAARAVDLRLTSAPIYLNDLELRGQAALVTPALDRAKFTPGKRSARRRVGFSGFVYESGRKGAELAARLAESTLADDCEFVASGRGWSVPTQLYAWSDMQDFYRGLDVYVCTATVEGVPMPPLEALACGVKVVIPRGVGLLDTLPNVPGIARYTAGDYGSLVTAVIWALETDANPDDLRGVTERFTAQAWAEDHRRAIAGLLDEPTLPPRIDWRERSGVYIVAFGEQARRCADVAIASWHEHMPGMPVALASDQPLGGEDVFIPAADADVGGRKAKIAIYENAPADWECVLYVDADTELVAPVPFLFEALADGWEFLIAKNPDKYHRMAEMLRPDNEAETALTLGLLGLRGGERLQLNGGVFGFRRGERVQRFFQRWAREWDRYGTRDQGALMRALEADGLRAMTLPGHWNTIDRYADPPVEETAGIVHHPMTARRYGKEIAGLRLDSPEARRHVEQRKRR